MGIIEDWEVLYNIGRITIFDCNNKLHFDLVKVANNSQKIKYPHVVSLNYQKLFYNDSYTDFKQDIREWLDERKECYYHPINCAVLMFTNKKDVMEFKLRWG